MRTLESAFAAHVATGATTLATCWRLERQDGFVLGFTDHDRDLAFGGVTYSPAQGLDAGEASRKLGGQVDTGDVTGVLSSSAITEEDIALGRYGGARVETWRVNWRKVEQRHLLRVETIGEIVREDGAFRAELRSAQAQLNVVSGRLYGALCDARLGDARCGTDLENPLYRAFGTVIAVKDRHRIAVDGLAGFAPGWFGLGHAVWTSGRRAGLEDRILRHTRIGDADILEFEADSGASAESGDSLTAYAGCDGRFETCRGRFANAVNFRGFPHVPGNDFVLRYPRTGDQRDGRPLWR